MPLVWCSISGHGYGHAAQVIPVLNELGRLVPDLRVLLRTTVPHPFFQSRLTIPFDLSRSPQDVGCVHSDGPLSIDSEATWLAHRAFHEHWDQRVAEEAAAIRQRMADLVLSDISYLAIEAGRQAGRPTVGLASLTWDQILKAFPDEPTQDRPWRHDLVQRMRQAYAAAELFIRPQPALPLPDAWPSVAVGPVVGTLPAPLTDLRDRVGAAAHERLIVVGFGGVAQDTLPYARLEALTGYRFLVDGAVPPACRRIHPLSGLGASYQMILPLADAIVSKPGYATVVEAVAMGIPLVYVRRYLFADEAPLVDYLRRHGRAAELRAEEFASGHWAPVLAAALGQTTPAQPPPPPTGATEAATILAHVLGGRPLPGVSRRDS